MRIKTGQVAAGKLSRPDDKDVYSLSATTTDGTKIQLDMDEFTAREVLRILGE